MKVLARKRWYFTVYIAHVYSLASTDTVDGVSSDLRDGENLFLSRVESPHHRLHQVVVLPLPVHHLDHDTTTPTPRERQSDSWTERRSQRAVDQKREMARGQR